MQNEKEIAALREMIEESVGRKIATPADFAFLADIIADRCREKLGITTLKRVWGYVDGYATIRHSTLSILAQCISFRDWEDFLQTHSKRSSSSQAVLKQALDVSQLAVDDQIRVAWSPDRRCVFIHRGEGNFEVLTSENSKLMPGDTFHCSYFILGHPLYLDHFVRGKKSPTMFVVGNRGGLTAIEKL